MSGRQDGKLQEFIATLRKQCSAKGICGIQSLASIFLRLDKDHSKTINIDEFRDGLKMFGVAMSEEDLNGVFNALDKSGDGKIEFYEFFERLRPPIAESRVRVINEAFDKADTTGDGLLSLDDLKDTCYSERARQHPKFVSGQWSENDVLRHFLKTFDTPGQSDGVVTREEFLNYYVGVSATVDDDSYFDMVMRKCWQLPPRNQIKTN